MLARCDRSHLICMDAPKAFENRLPNRTKLVAPKTRRKRDSGSSERSCHTSEEVEKTLAPQLSKLEEQIYNLKRQRVKALINEKLLTKEAG